MLEKISDIWNNYINNLKDSVSNAATEKLNEVIGNCLVSFGTTIEEIAAIAIVVGILLWITKRTKMFRIGCISYAIGLLIELIGLAIIHK